MTVRATVLMAGLAALTIPANAQEPPRRKCGTNDRYVEMYRKNASFRTARKELLSLTQAFETVRGSGHILRKSSQAEHAWRGMSESR